MSFWSKLGSVTKTLAQNVYQEIQKEQANVSKRNFERTAFEFELDARRGLNTDFHRG